MISAHAGCLLDAACAVASWHDLGSGLGAAVL